MRDLPEAGSGFGSHWFDEDKEPIDDNILSHLKEKDKFKKRKWPDAGIGIFDHWLDDD